MEDENQKAKEIIKPLQDTENVLTFVSVTAMLVEIFIEDLERFLSQWDVTQLRRRELLHKRWTERVWFPLQRRVEEHVSSCSHAQAKRRQSLYSHYLHHCNTKGFVFLETYDPKEYNPFLLNIKTPHSFKVIALWLKYLVHQRLKDKRTAYSCEAGTVSGYFPFFLNKKKNFKCLL
uniref:Uncharacterized protein n=1 Tax=Mastacembelus armatus TaxID=205130 RepID=A0A3Q3M8E4_9TELE